MSSPEWAKGYPLDLLKEIATIYKKEFSPHTYGAFGLPKERDVANAMSEDELAFTRDEDGKIAAAAVFKKMASSSSHEDFCGRQAKILKDDLFIKQIAGAKARKEYIIEKLAERTAAKAVWVEAHCENAELVAQLSSLGFKKILTKVSASSDIKGLFLRGPEEGRAPKPISPAEVTSMKCLVSAFLSESERLQIMEELHAYERSKPWQQHYSSYNKRQSWTAFALKGYVPEDPGFIIKPAEMSKKWKAENPDLLKAKCDITPAAKALKGTLGLISSKIPCEFQRVRLMRLSNSGGELSRHADITDPEAGVADKHLARLHIPLETAPGCLFRSWDLEGKENRMHFHRGGLFYLDTRKPHAVINQSDTTRIHLVIDAYSNDWLRGLLNG